MFVRIRKNRSGSMTVVVVDKSRGKFREVARMGTVRTEQEVEELCLQGEEYIKTALGMIAIDFESSEADSSLRAREHEETERIGRTRRAESLLRLKEASELVDTVLINGCGLVLGDIYDTIGFGTIADKTLRSLVIARIAQPGSKRATADYLKSHFGEDIHLSKIYRYLDRLYDTEHERVQRLSVEHTRALLGGRIGLMFYDVTTLYFETQKRDELRIAGFSKDGKNKEAQIVLGLLVSEGGYPLSYSIFPGNQYEGYTMVPVVEDFIQRYSLGDFVIVADSGLMNTDNIKALRDAGYKYIIGAKIKNEADAIKDWILSLPKAEGCYPEYSKSNGDRLILSYSEDRARKNAFDREKGVEKLRRAFKAGKLTKDNVNRRGYNKFLSLDGDVNVTISEDKIKEDENWDGLKGYVTNTDLPAAEVISQYTGLWTVENSFRITKGSFEMRPIFHFTERRIVAHICICFVALKVFKELERRLRANGIAMSPYKAVEVLKTVTTIIFRSEDGQTLRKVQLSTPEQLALKPLFNDKS